MSFEEGEERYFGERKEGEEYDGEFSGEEFDEGGDAADGSVEEFSEKDFEEGEGVEGSAEGPDFKSTFADFERTAGGAVGTGVSRIQKSKRSPQDAAQDKAKGILNDGSYDWIESNEKEKVYRKIGKIDNIERYNIETLVPAIIFVNKEYDLHKNFSSFYKKLFEINKLDLIRYIRFLQN